MRVVEGGHHPIYLWTSTISIHSWMMFNGGGESCCNLPMFVFGCLCGLMAMAVRARCALMAS